MNWRASAGTCSKFSLNDRLSTSRSGDRQPGVVLATAHLEHQREKGTAEAFQAHPLRHIGKRHCLVVHPERIAVAQLKTVSLGCTQSQEEILVPDSASSIYGRQIAHKRWRNRFFRRGHTIDDKCLDRDHASLTTGTG